MFLLNCLESAEFLLLGVLESSCLCSNAHMLIYCEFAKYCLRRRRLGEGTNSMVELKPGCMLYSLLTFYTYLLS
jgi:hypothetical protein